MVFDWQNCVVLLLVLAAGAYVGWRSFLTIFARKQSGCGGGCSSCPASKPTNEGFVSLDSLKPTVRAGDQSS
ncbi:FeoB-associated Cys-rich membrane protein [Lignipirellula cremea]|uniref:FeoB-associated Cys-rich membrane protein n=1 Tax=Lignipirellula cremea TaxID=2528010 RepID=UPI0018D25D07